jgi:radical SAM superfamily enzyme YgiQ (UPF0313 family)
MNTAKDEEVLRLMAESGCRSYNIGFESISEASLKEANKLSNKIAEYENAISNLNRYGIIPSGYFIFGFDNDDKTVFEDTLRFIDKSHIVNPYFFILTPYPGTRLYARVENRIFDRNWANYGTTKCVFTPGKMTSDELQEGTSWAVKEVSRLDAFKRQLEYFWSQSPWETNPALRLIERLGLIGLWLKLGRYKQYKEHRDFALWAAMHPKAADLNNIVSMLVFYDTARNYYKDGRNPA